MSGKSVSMDDLKADDSLVELLLPIVKILVRDRVNVSKFIRASKRAYVQAAAAEVFPIGSKINFSRLAVVTGLTRKDVSTLVSRASPTIGRPQWKSKEQCALRVVRGWRMDPRFQDENGRPLDLPIRGGRKNFLALVKLYAGDVTPISVLKELERLNMVSVVRSRKLRIRAGGIRHAKLATDHFFELAKLLGDFTSTADQRGDLKSAPVFFGFRDSTLRPSDQAARFQRVFSKRAAALLEGFDQWVESQPRDSSVSKVERARIGVGVYLVHDKSNRSRRGDLIRKRARKSVSRSQTAAVAENR